MSNYKPDKLVQEILKGEVETKKREKLLSKGIRGRNRSPEQRADLWVADNLGDFLDSKLGKTAFIRYATKEAGSEKTLGVGGPFGGGVSLDVVIKSIQKLDGNKIIEGY